MSPVQVDRDGNVTLIAGKRFAPSGQEQDGLGVESDDSRLSDARTPTAHAASHKHGGSDEVASAIAGANLIPKADGTGKLNSAWLPAGGGPPAAHASTHVDGGTDEIISALDTRAYPTPSGLLAARPAFGQVGRRYYATDNGHEYLDIGAAWVEVVPALHASSHQHGGSDPIAALTPAANAIPKALGGAPQLDPKWIFCELIKQSADATEAATTLTNTDLVFSYDANSTYIVDLYLFFRAAAATTGLALAWDTSTVVNQALLSYAHVLANTGTLTGGDAVADNTKRGISSGVNTLGVEVPLIAQGVVISGLNAGTCRLKFATEVNTSTVTFRGGSVMRVMKVV